MQSLRKLCLNDYLITADWPDDSKEGKATQEQNKVEDNFSDIEIWDGDLGEQKGKEIKKNNENQIPQPSPESTSTSKTLTPQPSKCDINYFGNQMYVSPASKDPLEDID